MERDSLTRQVEPSSEVRVVGQLLADRAVGRSDVGRIARQRDPSERSLALAEQRTDVRREEARIVEGPVEPTERGLGPQAVAVVEHLGAGVEEADHRFAVCGHGLARPAHVLVGSWLRSSSAASGLRSFGT